MDEWVLHQKNWLYLEPILNTAYAQKNLPKETKDFAFCDSQWKKLMRSIREKPFVKDLAEQYKTRQTYLLLKQNNIQFQQIKNALDEYIERKREFFQRFFFLSNEEILEMLSNVQVASKLQPYLRKIFENVMKLEIDAKENVIGMRSAENELILFKQCTLKGEIEEWMAIIEDAMKTAVK